jgi:RecA/RadA recombinase
MAALDIAADKQKALNIAIGQIEKAHGKGSIMRMGVNGPRRPARPRCAFT